jgi:hypothetical protein
MGTMIELRLGKLSVDWGKNEIYTDHRSLFQEQDIRRVISPEEEDESDEHGYTLAKPLRDVVPRLKLLGYGLSAAREEYESLVEDVSDSERFPSFDDFLRLLCRADINTVTPEDEYAHDHSFDKYFRYEIGPRLQIEELFKDNQSSWSFSEIMANFHPWYVMTMFAQKPANLNQMVVWDYSAHLQNGWSKPEDFEPKLKPEERFLIVTEGSSDSKVIRKGFDLMRPVVSDFFYFIDMEEGYPFSGSGNLANFCRGLTKIGIQNKTVILFDNDAEGVSKEAALRNTSRPPNLRIMRLPDHPDLRAFRALGTSGESVDDINGKAASIEAYLDFTWNTTRPARVRWTNYVEQMNVYQGALESKDFYVREFLRLRGLAAGYDTSKLGVVLEAILQISESIAATHPARSR